MAEMYYKLIKAGLRTLEQVPVTYRAEVEALLDSNAQ